MKNHVNDDRYNFDEMEDDDEMIEEPEMLDLY
jgi:hypothetical protein